MENYKMEQSELQEQAKMSTESSEPKQAEMSTESSEPKQAEMSTESSEPKQAEIFTEISTEMSTELSEPKQAEMSTELSEPKQAEMSTEMSTESSEPKQASATYEVRFYEHDENSLKENESKTQCSDSECVSLGEDLVPIEEYKPLIPLSQVKTKPPSQDSLTAQASGISNVSTLTDREKIDSGYHLIDQSASQKDTFRHSATLIALEDSSSLVNIGLTNLLRASTLSDKNRDTILTNSDKKNDSLNNNENLEAGSIYSDLKKDLFPTNAKEQEISSEKIRTEISLIETDKKDILLIETNTIGRSLVKREERIVSLKGIDEGEEVEEISDSIVARKDKYSQKINQQAMQMSKNEENCLKPKQENIQCSSKSSEEIKEIDNLIVTSDIKNPTGATRQNQPQSKSGKDIQEMTMTETVDKTPFMENKIKAVANTKEKASKDIEKNTVSEERIQVLEGKNKENKDPTDGSRNGESLSQKFKEQTVQNESNYLKQKQINVQYSKSCEGMKKKVNPIETKDVKNTTGATSKSQSQSKRKKENQ